jgi:hypothetical protein
MTGVPAFRLVEAGFSQPQVEALAEFMQTEAARRSDLLEVKAELKTDIAKLDGRVTMLQWMLGTNLTVSLLILGKLFLAH